MYWVKGRGRKIMLCGGEEVLCCWGGGKESCMRLDIHLFTQINLLDGIVDMIE